MLNFKNRTLRGFPIILATAYCSIFLFSNCTKDPQIIPSSTENTCSDIPPFSQVGSGYNYIQEGTTCGFPCFNPSDLSQMIFIKFPDSIFVYDFSTKSKMFRFKRTVSGKINWSSNNWLIYAQIDGNIYKCKPNGDSVVQLTFNNGNFYPVWSNDGTKFIAENINISGGGSLIYSKDGQILDTIEIYSPEPFSQWNSNDNVISGLFNVYTFNTNTKVKTNYYSINNGSLLGCFWLNNNEFLWSYKYGIFKTNIGTNETTLIKQTCNSSYYANPTYNSSTNKVVWEKFEQVLIDDYNVKTKRNLVEMNSDCSGEVYINLY